MIRKTWSRCGMPRGTFPSAANPVLASTEPNRAKAATVLFMAGAFLLWFGKCLDAVVFRWRRGSRPDCRTGQRCVAGAFRFDDSVHGGKWILTKTYADWPCLYSH